MDNANAPQVDAVAGGHDSQEPALPGLVGTNPPDANAVSQAASHSQVQVQSFEAFMQEMAEMPKRLAAQQQHEARWQNAQRRRMNARAAIDAPLASLEIENVAGPDAPLLRLPGVRRAAENVVRLAPGLRSLAFPDTKRDIMALTAFEIAQLAAEYNTDFGIVAGDSHAVRIAKVHAWATEW